MLLKNYLTNLKTHMLLNKGPSKDENNVDKKYYFIKLAILLALGSWIFDSMIHYFLYGESEFEIIPSDHNDLWMRSSLFILLTFFGFFADITSSKIIRINDIKNRAENILRAKKQWELSIDLLPQLVIAMDYNAKITRVNRTIEAWGMGSVNDVNGLNVMELLEHFNNYTDDTWTSVWPSLWKRLKNSDLVERKVEKKHFDKTYQYTLRKIPDYEHNKDQCYAVLVIDDITTRLDMEKSLKNYAQELEKEVNDRTLMLKKTNEQLEHELQIQKQAKEELKESQECRKNLLRDLFNTQETERKRIACELHDSLGQSLSATKFKAEEFLMNKQNFIDKAEHNQLNGVIETIIHAIDEVRHIAMDLRPAMLDDLGALATLKWFCREFGNTYKNITVETSLNVDESDIPEDRKVVIFRIVQEAMNNITKHANASDIILNLFKSASSMNLHISDNGCGFDMDSLMNKKMNQLDEDDTTPRCSFGLSSMRERAESTNGKFNIDSTPGRGTSVVVSWEN